MHKHLVHKSHICKTLDPTKEHFLLVLLWLRLPLEHTQRKSQYFCHKKPKEEREEIFADLTAVTECYWIFLLFLFIIAPEKRNPKRTHFYKSQALSNHAMFERELSA